MLTTGGGGQCTVSEVCFAKFTLGGLGACTPMNFRPSEITSGAFSSTVLLRCIALRLHYPQLITHKKSGNLS